MVDTTENEDKAYVQDPPYDEQKHREEVKRFLSGRLVENLLAEIEAQWEIFERRLS